MGLYEKAKNLVERASAASEEELKQAILEVDRYRRDLSKSLSEHANEEAYLGRRVAERKASLALWGSRRELAREGGRGDLVAEADARARAEEAELEALERQRAQLSTAIAHLTVNLSKVTRTLGLLREKRRIAAAAGARPSAPPDPIEQEFRRLEHEEVTRHVDRRLKPDEPDLPPPPRTSER